MQIIKRVMLCNLALLLIAVVMGVYMPANAQTDDDVPCINKYIVRDGDTLSKIAQANNVDVNELAVANGIEDPRLIFIGDTLCLDGLVEARPNPDSTSTTQAPPPIVPPTLEVQRNAEIVIRDVEYTTDENGIYIVRGFDRLYNLSAVFGVYMNELAAVNNITDPSVLYAGQQLIIPMPSYSSPVPGSFPAISLVPRVAGPGYTVTVRGANYPPDTEVEIYAEKFSTGKKSEVLETVTTDESGRFEVEVEIPETWSDGTPLTDRTISIVGRVSEQPNTIFGANFYLNLVWLDANNR